MTFQSFLEAYNGRYIDFDGYYGAQCMDLMHQYVVEVLGLVDGKILAASSAKDVFNNFATITGNQYFERIPNTPTGVPNEGDIVFWTNAPYGHVAIFVSGDTNKFKSFDQNYPIGSPCHVQDHTYTNIGGWLRCKQQSLQAELDKTRFERDRNWNWFTGLCDALNTPHVFEVAKAEIEKLVKLEDVVREKDQTITLKEQEINRMKEELVSIQEELKKASTANTEAQNAIVDLKQVVEEYEERAEEEEKTIRRLGDRIEELKKVNPIEAYTGLSLMIIGIKKMLRR